MVKRRLVKLGICPLCKRTVSKRGFHRLIGYDPQYRYFQGKYYHTHCWKDFNKARIKPTKIFIGAEYKRAKAGLEREL